MSEDHEVLIKYEIPLQKIVPKKLWDAQKSDSAMLSDSQLIQRAMPDSIDWRLRIRYNSLIQQIMDPAVPLADKIIRVDDIIKDICSYEVWKRRVDNELKAVFYMRRIGTYLEDQDALLTAMSARLWEIASAPIADEFGNMDMDKAKLLHSTIKLLLDRKFGQAVQRQVSSHIPSPQSFDPVQLERELLAAQRGLDVKELE